MANDVSNSVLACRQVISMLKQATSRLGDPCMNDRSIPGIQGQLDAAFSQIVSAAIKLSPHVKTVLADSHTHSGKIMVEMAKQRADPTPQRPFFDRSTFQGWTHEQMIDAYVGARTEVLQLETQLNTKA